MSATIELASGVVMERKAARGEDGREYQIAVKEISGEYVVVASFGKTGTKLQQRQVLQEKDAAKACAKATELFDVKLGEGYVEDGLPVNPEPAQAEPKPEPKAAKPEPKPAAQRRVIGNAAFDLSAFNEKTQDYLGVVCWFGLHEVLVPVADVKARLEKVGLPESLLIEPSDKKAFRRAADSVARRGGRARRERFARPIVDDASHKTIGIVDESVEKSTEQLEYSQVTTARFDKATKTVQAEGEHAGDVHKAYESYRGAFTIHDFRKLAVRTIGHAHGVAMRDNGGVYFVPRVKASDIVALNELLSGLGAGNAWCMRVPAGAAESPVVWQTAQETIEQRVADLLARVERVEKRASSLQGHEEAVEELRDMVRVYADLTQEEAKAEEMLQKLAAASNRIAERVAEIKLSKAS